jgi:hypothetical protein
MLVLRTDAKLCLSEERLTVDLARNHSIQDYPIAILSILATPNPCPWFRLLLVCKQGKPYSLPCYGSHTICFVLLVCLKSNSARSIGSDVTVNTFSWPVNRALKFCLSIILREMVIYPPIRPLARLPIHDLHCAGTVSSRRIRSTDTCAGLSFALDGSIPLIARTWQYVVYAEFMKRDGCETSPSSVKIKRSRM